jgi:CheY-like chemotaxis protein
VEVIEAADGVEMLRHVTRSRLTAVELDAVVLDLQMPRLGGIEALRRLRSFDPSLTVIVLSGSIEPALHRQAYALGASAVLQKPVTMDLVWDALLGHTRAGGREAALALTGIARPAPPRPADTHILIVDDNIELRETLVELLESRGYRTSVAGDGVTAIRAVTDAPVDIVLLDISIPGLSGADALPVIRALAPGAAVIMVTGNLDRDIARRTLAHGAFDYLVKPIDHKHLLQSIELAIEVKGLDEGAALVPPTRHESPPPPVATPAPSPWTMPSIKGKGYRTVRRYGGPRR